MSGGTVARSCPHRMDRFPHALENSSRLLRHGRHQHGPRRLQPFELGGWTITERGMQPLLVVDLLQKLADASARFGQVAILAAIDFFALQRLHERLTGRVVPGIAAARHADPDLVRLRHSRDLHTARPDRSDAPIRARAAAVPSPSPVPSPPTGLPAWSPAPSQSPAAKTRPAPPPRKRTLPAAGCR